MNVPEELHYSSDHEWVGGGDTGRVRIGITDYAQDSLGDVVFVQLPSLGDTVASGATLGEVESTKSVSDILRSGRRHGRRGQRRARRVARTC